MRDRDEPADPIAQDRFARLLTGVAEVPARSVRPFDEVSGFADGGRPGDGAWHTTPAEGAPHTTPAEGARHTTPAEGARAAALAALAGLSPGRRAMKPLIVVAVCVALVAAFVAWRSRPSVSSVAPAVSASMASTPPADAASAASPPPPPQIVVAIQGRVRRPGLVKLPAGARIADAIDAAGGVLPGTDLSYVNLAQKLIDGQLIVISKSGPAGGSGGAPAGVPASGSAGSGQLININTASESDFDTLPGIGPALAARIVAYRTQHGSFHSVDDLRNVSGIGDSKFAEIKDLVTV